MCSVYAPAVARMLPRAALRAGDPARHDDIPGLLTLARIVTRWESEMVAPILAGVSNARSEALNRIAKLEGQTGLRVPQPGKPAAQGQDRLHPRHAAATPRVQQRRRSAAVNRAASTAPLALSCCWGSAVGTVLLFAGGPRTGTVEDVDDVGACFAAPIEHDPVRTGPFL